MAQETETQWVFYICLEKADNYIYTYKYLYLNGFGGNDQLSTYAGRDRIL